MSLYTPKIELPSGVLYARALTIQDWCPQKNLHQGEFIEVRTFYEMIDYNGHVVRRY